ncbi:hypothetical protein ACJX0J_030354 [Zea mays]
MIAHIHNNYKKNPQFHYKLYIRYQSSLMFLTLFVKPIIHIIFILSTHIYLVKTQQDFNQEGVYQSSLMFLTLFVKPIIHIIFILSTHIYLVKTQQDFNQEGVALSLFLLGVFGSSINYGVFGIISIITIDEGYMILSLGLVSGKNLTKRDKVYPITRQEAWGTLDAHGQGDQPGT